MPAMWFSSSPASWAEVPMPFEPNDTRPGCRFASRISSGTLFATKPLAATRTTV